MTEAPAPSSRFGTTAFAWLVVLLSLAYLLAPLRPVRPSSEFHVEKLSKLPVSYKGRVKPFDTVARNSLMVISGRQKLRTDSLDIDAAHWLLNVLT